MVNEQTRGIASERLDRQQSFAEAAGLPIDEALIALAAWRARVAELPAVRDRGGQEFRREDIEPMSSGT